MQGTTGRFIAGLVFFTCIIGLIAFVFYRVIFPAYYPSIFPYMLGFFFLLNVLFFFVFIRINKTGNILFIRQFMILLGVKFFVYLSAAILILVLFRQQALIIAVAALMLYLLYTGYEVLWLTSMIKRKEHNK